MTAPDKAAIEAKLDEARQWSSHNPETIAAVRMLLGMVSVYAANGGAVADSIDVHEDRIANLEADHCHGGTIDKILQRLAALEKTVAKHETQLSQDDLRLDDHAERLANIDTELMRHPEGGSLRLQDHETRLAALEKTSETGAPGSRDPGGSRKSSQPADAPNEPALSTSAPDFAAMALTVSRSLGNDEGWPDRDLDIVADHVERMLRANAHRLQAPWSMTHAEIEVACRNIGFSLSCGA